MANDVLGSLATRDRERFAFGQDNLLDEQDTPVFQKVGGIVKSGIDTYTNLDNVPFTFGTDGRLLTDMSGVSLFIGSVTAHVDSIFVQSGTITSVGASFLSSGNVFVQSGNNLHVQGIGSIDAAITTAPVYVGWKAESTTPTEVADGDAVDVWSDTFGRQVLKGTNLGTESIDVSEVAPWGTQVTETTFTQLTAPGTTAVVNVSDRNKHTFAITVASIDTSVDVRIEGSLDNSNFFNMDDSGADTTFTANDTFLLHKGDFKTKFVRFNFVSEVGGTAATIDVLYMGGN